MTDEASEQAQRRYRLALDMIEAERALGGLTREQAAEAARAAREEYEQVLKEVNGQ
jgi:hypothetical protein